MNTFERLVTVSSLAFMTACSGVPAKDVDADKSVTAPKIELSPRATSLTEQLTKGVALYGRLMESNTRLRDMIRRDGSAVVVLKKLDADKPSLCGNYESGAMKYTVDQGRKLSDDFYVALFSLKDQLEATLRQDFPGQDVELSEVSAVIALGIAKNESVLYESKEISDNITTVCEGWEELRNTDVPRREPKLEI